MPTVESHCFVISFQKEREGGNKRFHESGFRYQTDDQLKIRYAGIVIKVGTNAEQHQKAKSIELICTVLIRSWNKRWEPRHNFPTAFYSNVTNAILIVDKSSFIRQPFLKFVQNPPTTAAATPLQSIIDLLSIWPWCRMLLATVQHPSVFAVDPTVVR